MPPYISFVFPCCNETPGIDPGNRVQALVTGLLEQCRRHGISSELILVEWLATENQAPLGETLRWHDEPGPCTVRSIVIPVGKRWRNVDSIPEAVAANAGIRRARGRFVLVADMDQPLSDELMESIGVQHQRFSMLEWRDIAAKDGSLMLGSGWFRCEFAGSKPFRWFNNDAEISIQHSDSGRVLALDIEPGPGVKMGPTTLDVLDDDDAKVVSVRLANRRVVNIPMPPPNGHPVRLRLRVSNAGHRSSRDPRPLNARVMRCGLYEAPMTARSWTLMRRAWWMLTRSAGSSLLPEVQPREKWPGAVPKACGGLRLLSRKEWFDLHGLPEFAAVARSGAGAYSASSGSAAGPVEANSEDWGLGEQSLKDVVVREGLPDPQRPEFSSPRLAVGIAEMALAAVLRSVPRPPLPRPGAFGNAGLEDEVFPPIENPPKISMVTPSYQQGRFLEWTMRSVLEQGYPNLEYIVMDGGSKDETRDILAQYKDRLAYCESAPDKGQADAVARGFARATGEIMGYLNSDDLLAPGALEFVARYFAAHPEVDAIYSHRVFVDESNIVTRYWILPPHHAWTMKRWDYIPQETCFWRRRIYEQAGGVDASYQFALDYDLFVRFMERGRMERVNRFLGAFREHPSSKTVLQEGMHPEVARVQKEHGITIAEWHRLPCLAQHELLQIRSAKFAGHGKRLPGALPGIGYDYDQVWRGKLNGPRSSSRNNSDIRPI